MLLAKIRSIFAPEQQLHKPRPSTIKNNYACEDATLEWLIKDYLNRQITVTDCVQGLIEHMAYDDDFHLKDNAEIFPIVEDMLESAKWKKEWTADCGDYNPERPEPWLRCIHNVYGNKIFYIKESETMVKKSGKEITAEKVVEIASRFDPLITIDMYNHKDGIISKQKELQAKIEAGDYTPNEALKMIKENWEYLYHLQCAYEAIEYCVAASDHHSAPKYFDSAFRDFGRKMGRLYRAAKEK